MRLRFAPLVAATLLAPAPLAAQIVNRPERAADVIARTSDPSHASTSLSFNANLLGGYDQNDADPFLLNPDVPVVVDSTSHVTVDAGLNYSRSRNTRSVGVSVNGTGTFYSESSIQAGPSRSFTGALTFSTPVGGDATRFGFDQRVLYDSLFSVSGFDDLALDAPVGEVPIGGATQGVAEIGSITSDTNLSLQRRLGRRSSLSGSYGYVRRVYSGVSIGETAANRASVSLARQMNRNTGLSASYSFSNGDYAPLLGGGDNRPLTTHGVLAGINYQKRLSPRRALTLSLGGGANRIEAVTGPESDRLPYAFWTPSGQVAARVDLVRTWALSANYSRGATALSGLTREAMSSDALGATIGGSVGRVELAFTAGFSRGATSAIAEGRSEYRSTTGTAQVGLPITKRLSGTVQYTWYNYELSGDALPTALPSGLARSGVRAGLSVRLPLIEPR